MAKQSIRLCFFDFETTGVNPQEARIVQGAFILADFDFDTLEFAAKQVCNIIVDPEIPIPEEASAVHGLTNEKLKELGALPFGHFAGKIKDLINSAPVLVGHNIDKYDLPVLAAEFSRVGITWPANGSLPLTLDTLKLEAALNPRNLEFLYKKYTGETLKDAHSALADTEATVKVFKGIFEKNQNDPDFKALTRPIRSIYIEEPKKPASVEESQKLRQDEKAAAERLETLRLFINKGKKPADVFGYTYFDENGELRFSFGKHRNKKVQDNMDFVSWMKRSNFPEALFHFIDKTVSNNV